MRRTLTAIARKAPPDLSRATGSIIGPRLLPRAVLAACAILVLAAGGCSPSKLRPIEGEQEFMREILKAERPALVYFTKDGCAACMFLNPCMDQLYDEYQDRMELAEFSLMTFWSEVKCERIWKAFRIAYYPTVVLFVSGKEKFRWVGEYNGDAYRKVLSEVVGPPAPKGAPPGKVGLAGKS